MTEPLYAKDSRPSTDQFTSSCASTSQRDCPKSLRAVCDVAPRKAENALFGPSGLPYGGRIHPRSVAQTRFRTVSEGVFCELRLCRITGKLVYSWYSKASTKSIPLASWWLRKRAIPSNSERKAGDPMSEEGNRNTLHRRSRIEDHLHDDYVEEYPQSSERIRGKGNWRSIL